MLSTRIMMTNYFNTWCLKLKSWIWESVISVKFFLKKSDNQGLSQGKHILSCLLVKKKRTMFLNVAYTWNTNKEKGKAAYIVGLKTCDLGE